MYTELSIYNRPVFYPVCEKTEFLRDGHRFIKPRVSHTSITFTTHAAVVIDSTNTLDQLSVVSSLSGCDSNQVHFDFILSHIIYILTQRKIDIRCVAIFFLGIYHEFCC